MDRREDLNVEYRIHHSTRGERWLTSIGRIIDPVNRPGYMTGISLDITERKKAEEQLRLAKQEADEANRAKDMFLATLSHEIRTPLSAIVGWMQILQGGTEGGCSDAELNEGLDVIERNARTMVQLIDDVMDVSRIVSGKVRLEVRPCELSAVIRAGIDVVRPAAPAQGHRADAPSSIRPQAPRRAMRRECSRSSGTCSPTPSSSRPREARFSVTLARERSRCTHSRSATAGRGLAPELLPYVFDRFRQADSSTRRRFGGLGLGLSIVKHLVELHGGTVQARERGRGTRLDVHRAPADPRRAHGRERR